MKTMYRLFTFLYCVPPLLIVPYIAYSSNDWSLLFGIVYCYLGVIIAALKPILFYIYLIFCFKAWFTIGFDIHEHIMLFFLCALEGFLFFQIADEFKSRHKKKINQYLEYDHQKKYTAQLEIEQYKKDNPKKKLTFEVMHDIKKRIFGSTGNETKK
jgi:hypothetical protein